MPSFQSPPLALLLLPVASTLTGGLVAIRFRKRMHVLLALGAGMLIGAAFLDLLPEALALGKAASLSSANVLTLTAASFLLFLAIDNTVNRFAHGDTEQQRGVFAGRLAGAMLIFHSFRDGMAIGSSYVASPAAGYTVALGIGAHDFGDGLNTVLLTTRGNKPTAVDYMFLAADALAPVLGAELAIGFFASPLASAILLAAAAGFFLQMAVNDLLPELRRYSGSRLFIVPTMLGGAGVVYLANRLLR